MGDADFKRRKELKGATKITDVAAPEVNNYAIATVPIREGFQGSSIIRKESDLHFYVQVQYWRR